MKTKTMAAIQICFWVGFSFGGAYIYVMRQSSAQAALIETQKELSIINSNTWELKTQIWRLENGKELEGFKLLPTKINIKKSLKKATFGKE